MKKTLINALFAALLLLAPQTYASGGGDSGAAGGALYAKLGTFTVNLQNISEVLQTDISVKLPNPQILDTIKMYLPFIKHELILLLSSQNAQEISTVAGKQKLIKETKTAVNRALHVDPKDGVSDVLFESFVIQQ
jgi:flagellar FliL protein